MPPEIVSRIFRAKVFQVDRGRAITAAVVREAEREGGKSEIEQRFGEALGVVRQVGSLLKING